MDLTNTIIPFIMEGKPVVYGDVKNWKFIKTWKDTRYLGDASKMIEVKCKDCGYETFFHLKNFRSGDCAECTCNPYIPMGQDIRGNKALPKELLHTWGVLSYVPGSRDQRALYNVECVECGKRAQFGSGDYVSNKVGKCNHDLSFKQGIGSDNAWQIRNPIDEECNGWVLVYCDTEVKGLEEVVEVKCPVCDKEATFRGSAYRNKSIGVCNHSKASEYGIGSDPSKRRRLYPVEVTEHKYYSTWGSIKGRTGNPNNQDYPDYGGRGIKIHSTWEDPSEFLKYIDEVLGDKPDPTWSINRIDNDGDYEPGNVEWASIDAQARNKRNVTLYTDSKGVGYVVNDLVDQIGFAAQTWRKALDLYPLVDEALFYMIRTLNYTGPKVGVLVKLDLDCKCSKCGDITKLKDINNSKDLHCSCEHVRERKQMMVNNPDHHSRKYSVVAQNSQYYRVWRTIMDKTTIPSHRDYKSCGALGIRLCPEWQSPENFVSWMNENMEERPSEGAIIVRIDTDKDFEPGNMKWTTTSEQNKTRAGIKSFKDNNGKLYTLNELVKIHGGKPKTWKKILELYPNVDDAINHLYTVIRKKPVPKDIQEK